MFRLKNTPLSLTTLQLLASCRRERDMDDPGAILGQILHLLMTLRRRRSYEIVFPRD
jgi:hypothetical protein